MNMSFEQKVMIYSVLTMILFVGIFALDISATMIELDLLLLQ